MTSVHAVFYAKCTATFIDQIMASSESETNLLWKFEYWTKFQNCILVYLASIEVKGFYEKQLRCAIIPFKKLFMTKRLFLIAILIVTLSSCMEKNNPLIIGHRGAMGHETENTLASIQKAMDLGADMVEIDVFKIQSGEIVVFHDGEVDRLTDGTGKIEAYDWEGLQKLTLEGGHKIPTLQQVLDVIDGKIMLNIELKGANTAEPTNQIVQEYCTSKGWNLDSFVISSFKWDELKTMRKVDGKIPIAILIGKNPLEAVSIGKELNAVAINPAFKGLTAENVAQMKAEGFKIYPWTVNEADDIALMKSFGVDGIITNFPERVH